MQIPIRRQVLITKAWVDLLKLAEDILVPSKWPLGGIDSFVLTLARKIIKQCDIVSSILQVRDIPAKLVTREDNNNSVYVFQEVSKAETVGAYVYEIVLPKEESSIRKRKFSGSYSSDESWPDYAVSASKKNNKISYYVTPPRLDEKTLLRAENNLRAARHRVSRVAKQFLNYVGSV